MADLNRAMVVLMREAKRILDAEMALLFLEDSESGSLSLRLHAGKNLLLRRTYVRPGFAVEHLRHVVDWVFRNRRPLTVLAGLPGFTKLPKVNIEGLRRLPVLGVPVGQHDRAIGVLVLIGNELREFSEVDQKSAQGLAESIGALLDESDQGVDGTDRSPQG